MGIIIWIPKAVGDRLGYSLEGFAHVDPEAECLTLNSAYSTSKLYVPSGRFLNHFVAWFPHL